METTEEDEMMKTGMPQGLMKTHETSPSSVVVTSVKQRSPENLNIDLYTNVSAQSIRSWDQMFDIKLLIKLKLNSNGYKFDYLLEKELENFVKMKQRAEKKQINTRTDLEMSQVITKYLNKWMMQQAPHLIKNFEPSHEIYNQKNRSLPRIKHELSKSSLLDNIATKNVYGLESVNSGRGQKLF